MRWTLVTGMSTWALLVCGGGLLGQQAGATRSEARARVSASAAPARQAMPQYVRGQVETILDGIAAGAGLDAARRDVEQLFDQVAAWGRATGLDELRHAAFAQRLVTQLAAVPQDRQLEMLQFLRAHESLARSLAFLLDAEGPPPAAVYAVLDRLRAQRPGRLEEYANLAAAICTVHARPLKRRINENVATAPDPVEIFDYYVNHEKRMFFGIRQVPPELLAWVVDTTASIEEMAWALQRYGGDAQVGGRFFDIEYDYEHFRAGTPKKVTGQGFTLPNILQYGGVCADQAYFAMSVGKAIGVPTAYAVGSSAETGHAWVGFLAAQGGRGWWNFDTGRYSAYRGVKGSVRDPLTGRDIPDSHVSLLAELIRTRADDRHAAAALTDAARRLVGLQESGRALEAVPVPPGVSGALAAPRTASTAEALALLEAALRQSTGHAAAWFAVRDLAKDKRLSLADKKKWAGMLQRLGGAKYPDFTLDVLAPMIETVEDPQEQNALWNAAFTMFQNRHDLAASIRMSQAALWESQNDVARAGACYMDVIERYANAGPFVIEALKRAEALLRASDRSDRVVALYGETWSRLAPPREMNAQATAQSNWWRVGKAYAAKLEEAGEASRAAGVVQQLQGRGAASSGPHPAGRSGR